MDMDLCQMSVIYEYGSMSNACNTNKYNICANDAYSHNTLYNLKT